MEFKELELAGVILITPKVFGDNRGFFMETYRKSLFLENGIDMDFIQDNHSRSAKGILRGLHFQKGEFAQDKLVRVTQGAVYDVAVDLQKESPTFGRYVKVELSEDNKQMLLVPKGFAHGFLALTDIVDFQYKVTTNYSPENEVGIAWNDPDIGVDWGIDDPTLSEKDSKNLQLSEIAKEDLF